MNRQRWLISLLALAMIAAAAGALNRLKANQRLGLPGIKASPIAGSRRLDLYLPEHVLNYDSVVIPVELGDLPPDTSIVQRRYLVPENPNDQLILNIVLMGTDRTSIHKPQFCLTGSGIDIDEAESAPDTLHLDRPHPYDLPVMKLSTSRQIVSRSGEKATVHGVYVYWFVADHDLTASHWVRMRDSATHLISTGELQRWAYVACFAECMPGGEQAMYERMQRFLVASVPEFQLVASPANPGREPIQKHLPMIFNRHATSLARHRTDRRPGRALTGN